MWAYNDLICPYLGVFNPIANISFIIDRVVVYQGYTLVTETLMACMVAGALIPLISDKPRVGLAGFLIGLATLFKQPALLFLIPLELV